MNKNLAIGIGGAVVLAIVLYGLYTFTGSKPSSETPQSAQGTSTDIIGAPSSLNGEGEQAGEAQAQGADSAPAPQINVQVHDVAIFDYIDRTADSGSVIITGISNTKAVDIIVVDSTGRGLAAGRDIEVQGGRWSYSPPLILQPGVYTIQLLAGAHKTQTSLTVKY